MEVLLRYPKPRFAEKSVNFFIKHLGEKLEPIKNNSAEEILIQLGELYKEVRTPTTLALALNLLAGNQQNKDDGFIKELSSKQGDSSLSRALNGEFCSDGFGHIDHVSENGILFLRRTYFPGAGNDEKRREEVIAAHQLRYENPELLILEAKLVNRFIEVRVDDRFGNKICVEQTTTFINTQTKTDILLTGPLIVLRNEEPGLYTSEKGKNDWIKVIDIIREPGILKG